MTTDRESCAHEHQMANLVDRFERWKGYECPYCEIERLRGDKAALLNELHHHFGCDQECEKRHG
jgi:hypothetical protein